jgi:hypothetical protein
MTDEPPAVRLIPLGDPEAAGLCVDGVCHLPAVTPAPVTPAPVTPAGIRLEGDAAEPAPAVDPPPSA